MPTVGQILLKSILPKDLHHLAEKPLDKKGIGDLFSKLSDKHADKFNHIASELARVGFETSTQHGSSITLNDLNSPIDKDKRFEEHEKEIAKIKAKGLSPEKERKEIAAEYSKFIKEMNNDIMSEGLKHGKTLAKIIQAGSRGSAGQYRQTVAAPVLALDKHGIPMFDFPIKHSFAEGLTLPEYLATSYETRSNEVAKKLGTANSGFAAKKFVRSSMTIICEEHDCNTEHGIPVPASDKDSIGSFLAHPVGTFNRNNEVTAEMLATLQNKKIENIVVRSPLTCQSSRHFHPGAVCQMCVGIRENGLPAIGSYIGVSTAGIISEPLSQAILGTKHLDISAKTNVASGFSLINQLAEIPKEFPNKAIVSDIGGKITDIKKSEAGGYHVTIGDNEHYVGPGFNVLINKGDTVEKGDVLTEGVINPAEIVKFKGIGEGRKHYVEAMHAAFKGAGIPVNRRNFEIIAKNAIDHVRITNPDGLGDYLPDQIISYQGLERSYKPRENSKLIRIDAAKGKYLEIPVLHFTIGTPITESVIKQLKDNKIESITVNDEKPGFEPEMIRLVDIPEHVDDWMHQLYSTNLERRLTNIVNTGVHSSSDIKGPSPIPGLAYGVGFGSKD